MRDRCILAVAIALSAGAATARAGAQTPEREQIEQTATVHLRTATTAFEERRFDVAAREFEVAYELTHNASLLFNAGSAWGQVPDVDRALAAYRRFLQEAPDHPNVTDVRARIAVLERTREREPAPAPTPTPAVTAPPSTPPQTPPRHPPPPPPRSHTWRTVGIISGAGGVVLGGLGIGVYVSASRDFDTLQNTCAPRCSSIEAASIDRRATTTNVLLGLAGAAMAFSAVSFVLELTGAPRSSNVTVAFAPLSDGAIAVVGGRL